MDDLPPEIVVLESATEWDFLAELCRRSYWEFVKEFWGEVPGAGKLKVNWHLKYFCDELQTIMERVIAGLPKEYDLVVNCPPGTSKSTIFSILLAPWLWTRMASCRNLSASHTDSLCLDLSAKSRTVIKSEKYRACFSEVVLREDQDTKGYFATTAGGDRYTCTVAGKSPMGFHGHVLGLDDPLDPKKVLSEAEIKTAAEFTVNVLPTRKVDKAVAVIYLVMQRLGIGDPTDVMLEGAKVEGAAKVRHICLPAELTDDVKPPELREFYVDGLLDPVRLSSDVLREYKARGEHFYATQFLQKPYLKSGGMFREEVFNQRCKASPFHARRIRYWDRACCWKNSLITMRDGDKPICEVRPGDMALTRDGYREVVWAGATKEASCICSVLFSDGSVVSATPEHLIWTKGRGWVRLDSLSAGDYIEPSNHLLWGESWQSERDRRECRIPSSSYSGALPTAAVLERGISRQCDGTRRTRDIIRRDCTRPFGSIIGGVFPLAMSFTTLTKTRVTTRLEILSACLGESMDFSMPGSCQEMARFCGKARGREDSPATNVERGLSLCLRPNLRFVVTGVGGNLGRWSRFVPHANLLSLRIESLVFALESVRVDGGRGIPVYDLEVEGAHEFFANGILVHNSTEDSGCRTAGVLLAYDGKNYFVEDVVKGQWEPDRRNAIMRATALKDRQRYGSGNEPQIRVEREGGSSGRDAWKQVARDLAGFPLYEDTVTGDKETRAEPWACQLAAGNVYLVDNGASEGLGEAKWDINGYIQEHCAFPFGPFMDQVDASSGAFNSIVGGKADRGIRVLSGTPPTTGRHIVVASRASLIPAEINDPCLLVSFNDVGDDALPGHSLNKLAGSLVLQFADVDPADWQDRWDECVPPYGKVCQEVMMQPAQGKSLWSFLLRKRDPMPGIIVLAGEGNVPLSAAFAIADVLRWKRQASICLLADDEAGHEGKDAPNRHVFEVVKSTRGMVI